MAHIKRFNEEYIWGGFLSQDAIEEIVLFIKNRLEGWTVQDENLLKEGIKNTIEKSMIMPNESEPRTSHSDDIDRRETGYFH